MSAETRRAERAEVAQDQRIHRLPIPVTVESLGEDQCAFEPGSDHPGDTRPLPGNVCDADFSVRGLTRAGGRTAQADEALSARDRHQPAGTWLPPPPQSRYPSRIPKGLDIRA